MELNWRNLSLILLFTLQWVVSSQGHECQAPEGKCDFICDCSDCSDEDMCGYRAQGFMCDFEAPGNCGWTVPSTDPTYEWQKYSRGNPCPCHANIGPSSDFTTGTSSGFYMGVNALTSDVPMTTVLVSPVMRESAPTCRLRLQYFLWDSGNIGLGSTPLWASVVPTGFRETVAWRPEATSVRGWREATIFLGRISSPFRIHLNSQRSKGNKADVAVDHMEFLDCALPIPVPGQECPNGTFECRREGCVSERLVCDGSDDCGDGSDEVTCGDYWGCDFETGLCNWDLRSISTLKWQWTNQENISTTEPLKGPGRDHSENTASGHFLYVTVPDGGLGGGDDWAAFQSPLLEPTNSTHPCKMVMYTHQFGPRSGGLTVLVADTKIYPVWERGGALGDLWVKAEVEIHSDSDFHIIFMAAMRDFAYGGIAIDSIMMSPECRLSNGNQSKPTLPEPPGHPCTDKPEQMCDFHPDCTDGRDEANCGDFSTAGGSTGWTDASVGGQQWVLHKNETSNDEYLYVVRAPGQQLTEAQTLTPLLGPSGPACNVTFSYALTGNPTHIGEVSLRVVDSVLGIQPKLWEYSGKTGQDPESWLSAVVPLGARKYRFQLAFEARAKKLCHCAKLKVRDVRYHNCYAGYLPSSPTGMACNFEDSLCGWYQDKTDNFDWTVLPGMDHTIGVGKSLVVDVWDPELRGAIGRLLSFPQAASSRERCLTFYYKLYGPQTGVLNVKLMDSLGSEDLLWTRTGAHGNVWHEGHATVPNQHSGYQLVFEAIRYGFDGRVAIDDVALLDRPCSVARMCSFEGQHCGYKSSGTTRWLHRQGRTATNGPRKDHTLETPKGFYMMAETDMSVLAPGSTTTLSSPVRSGAHSTECVHFWYHNGGGAPGSLTVYMKPVVGERVVVFSDSLDQGDEWRHASGNITSTLVDWQLEFEVTGAGGRNTHIAIDDVILSGHPCQDQGSKCSLERGLCGWSNTQSHHQDQLDWELTSQETEKHYLTPPHDHTLGTERGHFLFLPGSSRTPSSNTALLLSAHLPPTKGTCLRFWAHRPSSSDSQLKVKKKTKGELVELLVVTEVAGVWRRFDLTIESTQDYQILLEGIKGSAGVLALDDIELTIGVDCDGNMLDTLPPKPPKDDKGGIAASVIVVMLLVGTLCGLLYYYLKTRERAKMDASPPASGEAGGFSNEIYEPDLTQDRVTVPPVQQNHDEMIAGFTNETYSESEPVVREMEVA